MNIFEQFLLDHKDIVIEKRTLLFFSERLHLFQRLDMQPPVWRLPVDVDWKSTPHSPIPEALAAGRTRLNNTIPPGYTSFVSLIGPGRWAGTIIEHPHHMYPFDLPDELAGYVVLASMDGNSDIIAYNPKETPNEGQERKIYYCSSDPLGSAIVADSFEDWIYRMTPCWLKDPSGDALYKLFETLEFTEFDAPK